MTTSSDNFEMLPSDIGCLDMIEAITVMDALKSKSMDATDEPESLPVNQVVEVPSVFQVRGGEVTESHIHGLNEVLERGQDLDPILVMRVGGSVVLVDGHHRLETYRRYEKKTKEPQRVRVVWHRGDLTSAMAEASQRNQKISLAMTKAQKLDNAWKMTVTRRFTIPQLQAITGVSHGSIDNMRRALKVLTEEKGMEAADLAGVTWRSALRLSKDGKLPEVDYDEWAEVQAQEWADRLAKQFALKMVRSPQIAAKAMAIHFGRKATELLEALKEETGYEGPEFDYNDDF